MKNTSRLTVVVAVLFALALPATASAVVPNFTVSEPTNGQRVKNYLSVSGYSSNVDIAATCTIPNLAPYFITGSCTYMNRWVSSGYALSPSLAEGNYTVTVSAVAQDGSGQSTTITRSITVDKTAPTVSILSGPANGINTPGHDFSFTFSANESANFECNFDGAGWTGCSSPAAMNSLDDGQHSFSVRASDSVGNASSDVTRTFTVNNAPPTATIVSVGGSAVTTGETAYTSDSSPWWGFGVSRSDGLLECSLDEGPYAPCPLSGYEPELTPGTHTLDVRAYLAGHTNVQDPPVRATIVYDNAEPVASFSGVPTAFAGTSATIEWSANEPLEDSYCELSKGDEFIDSFTPCPTEFHGLDGGEHTLRLWTADLADNESEVLEFRFTVYPDPPDTTIAAGQSPVTAVDSASFTLGSQVDGSTFECRIDVGSWFACSSSVAFSNAVLAGGSHVIEARAVDPAGQSDPSPATGAFTLKALPVPDTKLPAPSASKVGAKGKSLTLNLSGGGKVAVKIETCTRKGKKTVCKKFGTASAVAGGAGKLTIKLKKSFKKKSKYRVTVTTTSATGETATTIKTIKAK